MKKSGKFGLSIFFPCYNDAGTIDNMVITAIDTAKTLTDDYEVIVVDDGSSDSSREILKELQKQYDKLRLVFHKENGGYGRALKSGFAHATKELVFYTDGDGQYDVKELKKLIPLMKNADVVNGYKIKRADKVHRRIIGRIYHWMARIMFNLKLKDVDCDFRLLKSSIFNKIELESDTGVICVEMMKKIQDAGYKIVEVPVHHYPRVSGSSQFFRIRKVGEVVTGLVKQWWQLVLKDTYKRKLAN